MIFGGRVTPRYMLRGDSQFDAVRNLAQAQGWSQISDTPADPGRGVAREATWLTQTTITLQYEEDPVSQQACVFYAGDDLDALPGLVEVLRESLDTWSSDELLRGVASAQTGPERARAVLRLGLGTPLEFDQRFFDAIKGCMESGETPLRDAGVLAAGAASWPQFRPILRRLAGADPEEEVRDMAQATLRAYDEFRIGEL